MITTTTRPFACLFLPVGHSSDKVGYPNQSVSNPLVILGERSTRLEMLLWQMQPGRDHQINPRHRNRPNPASRTVRDAVPPTFGVRPELLVGQKAFWSIARIAGQSLGGALKSRNSYSNRNPLDDIACKTTACAATDFIATAHRRRRWSRPELVNIH